jgi:hypothetical protein
MNELCYCGHSNDHRGKQCDHEDVTDGNSIRCNCKFGMRVDIATFQAITNLEAIMGEINVTLARILAIAETGSNLETRIAQTEKGARVEVRQKPQKHAGIIVPG